MIFVKHKAMAEIYWQLVEIYRETVMSCQVQKSVKSCRDMVINDFWDILDQHLYNPDLT